MVPGAAAHVEQRLGARQVHARDEFFGVAAVRRAGGHAGGARVPGRGGLARARSDGEVVAVEAAEVDGFDGHAVIRWRNGEREAATAPSLTP